MEQHFKDTLNQLIQKHDILSLGKKNNLYIEINTHGFIIHIFYNKDKDIYHIEHKYKENIPYIRYYNIKDLYINSAGILPMIHIIMNNFRYSNLYHIYITIKDSTNKKTNIIIETFDIKTYFINSNSNVEIFIPFNNFEKQFNEYFKKAVNLITNIVHYVNFI